MNHSNQKGQHKHSHGTRIVLIIKQSWCSLCLPLILAPCPSARHPPLEIRETSKVLTCGHQNTLNNIIVDVSGVHWRSEGAGCVQRAWQCPSENLSWCCCCFLYRSQLSQHRTGLCEADPVVEHTSVHQKGSQNVGISCHRYHSQHASINLEGGG